MTYNINTLPQPIVDAAIEAFARAWEDKANSPDHCVAEAALAAVNAYADRDKA